MHERLARTLTIVAIAAAACAHGDAKPAAPAKTAAGRLADLLASLPACASTTGALSVASAAAPELQGQRMAVYGHFVYDAYCTAMACNHECCNKCRGAWQLGEGGDSITPALLLHPADEKWRRLAWSAMDCELRELRARSATTTIVVTGVVRPSGECSSLEKHAGSMLTHPSEIVYTDICAVRERR
jgi:hypothetical protein